jgi:hypothetical protein
MGRIAPIIPAALLVATGCTDLPGHDCERPLLVVQDAAPDSTDPQPPPDDEPWDDYTAPPLPWQGAYEGPLALFRDLDGELVEFCQGSATALIDERATVEAFGGCDGPSPGGHIEIALAGRVDEHGRLREATAELWLEFDPFQSPVFPADGGFPDREQHLELGWTGSYALPDGYEVAFVAGGRLFER